MKGESELMQKRKASDSDYLPEQKRQIVEKGKFVGAVVGVIKPDAYKTAHSDITNSPVVLQGCISSNTSSSSKIYEEDIVHNANDEAIEENSKSKEDNGTTKCKNGTLCTSDSQMVVEASNDCAERNLEVMEETFKEKVDNCVTKCKKGALSNSSSQMVLEASEGSAERNLKAMEDNFKAKENNGATKCKDGTLSTSDSQMVLEASPDSAVGNLKALSSECREHPSPIRGVIHDSPSLNETCDKSLIKSSEKEGCFSFQATDETKTAEVSNNHSETLESKNDPINVISNDEIEDTIAEIEDTAFESLVESQFTNTYEKNVSDFASQDKLPDANIIKPERKLVVSKRRKLLVLDVNGLLVDIISDVHNAHRGRMRIGGKAVFKRPFCDDFIKFCFEKFDIGIWSSRKRYNVEYVVEYLMSEISHELLFCWGQDHCTSTGFTTLENVDKPLVLKELKKLWNKEEKGLPWKNGYFSPSNTLLIDDSPYKALCNPPHTAIFPHPYHFDNENDSSLGPGGDLRVYLEGLYEADDVQLYVQQHPFGQQAITSEDSSWSFYSQVVEKIGRTLVIEQSFGAPKVTKHGVTATKSIEFKDRVKNMGASLVLKQVANATNDNAGMQSQIANTLPRPIGYGAGPSSALAPAITSADKAGYQEGRTGGWSADPSRLRKSTFVQGSGSLSKQKNTATNDYSNKDAMLSGSTFMGRSSGSWRKVGVSSSRDITPSSISHITTESNSGILRKNPSAHRNPNIKDYESTLKGIEGLRIDKKGKSDW